MAKYNIKHERLTNKEYNKILGKDDVVDLILNTGVRIAELKRIIDDFNGNDYIDIKTKKSIGKNRIFFNKTAIKILNSLESLKGVSIKTLYRKVKKVSFDTGIDFSPHNLRATFCSRLLELGVPLVVVQDLMNHSDISQTAKYARYNESFLRNGVSMLEKHETFEGMNFFEMKEEIFRLRNKIKRMEFGKK